MPGVTPRSGHTPEVSWNSTSPPSSLIPEQAGSPSHLVVNAKPNSKLYRFRSEFHVVG